MRTNQVTVVVFFWLVYRESGGGLEPSRFQALSAYAPILGTPRRFDLTLLSANPSAETLLTRLESLEVHLIASFTDEDVLDLIESRINAFRRVKQQLSNPSKYISGGKNKMISQRRSLDFRWKWGLR